MRRKGLFTADDVTRALKGARNAGATVARLEVMADGRIVLVTAEGAALDAKAGPGATLSPLQRWKAEEEQSGVH